MPPEMLFDYLAVHLNGPKAAGKKIGLNISFTDLKAVPLWMEDGDPWCPLPIYGNP